MRKKVVVIGGGSGTFNILRGLKTYAERSDSEDSVSLSAIVTMMDSGGSSGILRDEYGILPQGDVRRCLVALSDETEVMKKLFNYRFDTKLAEHSFGNLFLAALTQILGSEEAAIIEAQKILKVNGNVIPVTLDNCELSARLTDGTVLARESDIDIPKSARAPIQEVFLSRVARANPAALVTIAEADVIILGPGDLYTSIIPNLLVSGVCDAINASKALKIYNCNIMTKHGETDGYDVARHVAEIKKFVALDVVTYNTAPIPLEVLEAYAREKAIPVALATPLPNARGADLIIAPTLRHDPQKTGAFLVRIIFGHNK